MALSSSLPNPIGFVRERRTAIYSSLLLALVAVFIADLFTPLGVAVWILYLVPLIISLLSWNRAIPLVTATIATGLAGVGFFLSPPGLSPSYAMANRLLGILTVWLIAIVASNSIRNKIQVRLQEWLQAGRTGLSERMGGDHPLPELGDAILRFLAEYLNANAGAIYAADGTVFRRMGQYALASGSGGLAETFAFGEGLLGQAAKDRRTLVLNEVPEDYFTICSGLGARKPRHLLVTPLAVDNEVVGVIELGFFHALSPELFQLLDRVSDSIAVALRSAKYRGRLQQLLQETQRQAEELQAQSEELRVSNEELEEQSRALKESQSRLEAQQAELEQTNTQLEEQATMLEAQKHDLSLAKAELEKQAVELRKASQYKSDFLANMSHELRTPLNSSLILAKLLADNRDRNLTPEQVKYAQTIHSAGNDLLSLITEILDLSKIEAGQMEVHYQKIPIPALFESLRRTFEPLAADKGLKLQVLRDETVETLRSDSQRLEQVLRNLLSNAIKFTETGSVTLELGRTEPGKVAFSVRDTGVGIPAHQQRVIFEPFRQADGTTNRRYGGTGLGLSIARQLAHLLGGDLSVASQEGRGSVFTVTLPEHAAGDGPHYLSAALGRSSAARQFLRSKSMSRCQQRSPCQSCRSMMTAAAWPPVNE